MNLPLPQLEAEKTIANLMADGKTRQEAEALVHELWETLTGPLLGSILVTFKDGKELRRYIETATLDDIYRRREKVAQRKGGSVLKFLRWLRALAKRTT